MTMTATFKTNKTNNNGTTFLYNNKLHYEPNYSKIIDDIILADIKKKNSYLYDSLNTTETIYKPISFNYSTLKEETPSFLDAIKFLTNYKKCKKISNIPFAFGKMYTLSDGTPIVFYDDEIQIGFDIYKYSDFTDLSFLNGLTDNTKKTIINIYAAAGTKININLL
jgi:hypothetical protein